MAVAPGMSTHPPPAGPQRSHWRENPIGSFPVHVPWLAVSVWPARSVPAIVGGASAVGGSPTSRTSCGARPPSFVDRTSSLVVLGRVRRKETGPGPATALVTSISSQAPAGTDGTVATSAPGAGAFACVSPVSLQAAEVA